MWTQPFFEIDSERLTLTCCLQFSIHLYMRNYQQSENCTNLKQRGLIRGWKFGARPFLCSWPFSLSLIVNQEQIEFQRTNRAQGYAQTMLSLSEGEHISWDQIWPERQFQLVRHSWWHCEYVPSGCYKYKASTHLGDKLYGRMMRC